MLGGVGEGVNGVGMGFDEESVGAYCEGGPCECGDHFDFTGGMAGVDDDGEVCHGLGDDDGAQVEGVSSGCLEGADAAFAEDDIGASAGDEVFGGSEPFFDGFGHSSLQENGFSILGDVFEEVEVLGVAGAYLEDVADVIEHLDLHQSGDFGDVGDAEFFFDIAHDADAVEFESLEVVGAGSGFEGHGADDFNAAVDEVFYGLSELSVAFDGAGACDNRDVASADFLAAYGDDGVFGVELAGDEFVFLLDWDYSIDHGEGAKDFHGVRGYAVADAGYDDVVFALGDSWLVAQGADEVADCVDVALFGVGLEDDDHGMLSVG